MADSRLQKSPIGLIGAFDLQHQGQSPDQFGGTIQPTVDVFDLYMRPVTGSRGLTVAGNLQTSGDALSLTVPAGEMWRLWSVSCGVIVPAATANPDGLGLGLLVNAGYVRTEYYRGPTPTVGEVRFSVGLALPRPYLLPSGDSIGVVMQLTIGAASPAFLVVVRDRFPAL